MSRQSATRSWTCATRPCRKQEPAMTTMTRVGRRQQRESISRLRRETGCPVRNNAQVQCRRLLGLYVHCSRWCIHRIHVYKLCVNAHLCEYVCFMHSCTECDTRTHAHTHTHTPNHVHIAPAYACNSACRHKRRLSLTHAGGDRQHCHAEAPGSPTTPPLRSHRLRRHTGPVTTPR